MSIEALMTRLCEALEAQTAFLVSMQKTPGKAAAAAPAETPAATKAPAKAAAKAAPAKAAAGKKTPTAATISERFAAYMKNGDDDDRNTAKANVRALVTHYGAPKLTEIDAKHFPRVLEYLTAWEAGEEVEFDELDAEEDNGEDDASESLL